MKAKYLRQELQRAMKEHEQSQAELDLLLAAEESAHDCE